MSEYSAKKRMSLPVVGMQRSATSSSLNTIGRRCSMLDGMSMTLKPFYRKLHILTRNDLSVNSIYRKVDVRVLSKEEDEPVEQVAS